MFNCKEAPFSDRRMRLAVAHAVDRDYIVTTFLGSSGRKSDTVYGQEKPWGVEVEPIAHDLDKARALVREAGYGEGVTVKTMTTNVAPVPKIAEAVAKDLAQIGIIHETRRASRALPTGAEDRLRRLADAAALFDGHTRRMAPRRTRLPSASAAILGAR